MNLKSHIRNVKDFPKAGIMFRDITTLLKNPEAKIHTLIAIPYNPYEPQPYQRWTMRGMLDIDNELKVADEFWDFLGGTETYTNLLDCFERVGIELRNEIDAYFEKFSKTK